MRIVLDVNGILNSGGGVSNFVRRLVVDLAAIDSENQYVLYLHQWSRPDPGLLEQVIPRRPNFRFIWHRVPNSASLYADYKLGFALTERLLGFGSETVYHGPSNLVPRLRRMRSLITLHHFQRVGDPLFLNKLNRRERFYFNASEAAVKNASHVAAISETTRRDIVDKLGIPRGRISVIYPGGPRPTCRPIENAVLPQRFATRLPGRFVMFMGPINERKNLPAFLEAFASVKREIGDSRLAITGQPTSDHSLAIADAIRKWDLSERVEFLGDVSDEEMALLLNRAVCLAYPSLYEGFGAPPIEAMACGCPVIASNAAAIPEVTGGAALLFDGTDVRDMANALFKIHSDDGLRRDLVEKGLARSKDFSWRRMAQEYLSLYRKISQR